MFGADEPFLIAVLLRLVHAAAYLGLGGILGWSLRRGRTRGVTSTMVTVEPDSKGRPIDPKKAEALLTQLHDLTTDVAQGVGEHSSHVAAVGRELTALAAGGDVGRVAPVVQAVASLLQANARLEQQLAHASNKMQEQAKEIEVQLADALTDPLTGIANRRAFNQELSRRIPDFRRMGTRLSLIMMDVDYFKKFNDTHGHQAGDEVLRGVAAVLKGTVREMDLPVRYGGEEFAVILPNTGLDATKQVAERIRVAIEAARFRFGETMLRVTASIGLAEIEAGDGDASLIQRADEALYAAKSAGRNNVHVHDGSRCIALTDAAVSATCSNSDSSSYCTTPSPERKRDHEPMCGLPGRDELVKELERRLEETRKTHGQLALLMVEIDQFAKTADGVATESARMPAIEAVQQALPAGELIASLGPAVFGAVVGGSDAATALELADVINSRFRAECGNQDANGGPLTLSFGIAEGRGEATWASVFSRAEEALRASRLGGGNRIHFHTDKTRQPMLADLQVLAIDG